MSDVGSLVLVKTEYSDQSGWKKRPGLVIAEYLNDYLIAFVTKETEKYGDESTSMVIGNEDLASGKLKQKSLVRTHKAFWCEKGLCERVGALREEAIDRALRLHGTFAVRNYYDTAHRPKTFVPGQTHIPVAGRVYGAEEMETLVDSAYDFWLTAGRYAEAFEEKFAAFLGVKHCSLTNSGSSANLLAFMALTSSKLGERRILPGEEVITVAAGFPTTVAPIIQYGAVPVFVDVSLPTYNIDCDQLESALSEKTKAVMVAHTLGNPFDIDRVLSFCQRHNLWLIEDCCDALGSTYTPKNVPSPPAGEGPGEGENLSSDVQPSDNVETGPISEGSTRVDSGLCGSFGHLSTFSFYPAHHITMGEGGAVCTNDSSLKRLVESFRDWGRDCWCAPGKDNTCGHRFDRQFGELPLGYDHKYVYSHLGYNLKTTDMQAAIGCAQLQKLPAFIEARKKNFKLLFEGLEDLQDRFILPEATPNSDPSWFGFPITVKENAGFTRDEIVRHLESHKIQTRMLFAGNLIRHPCFDELRSKGLGFRIVSPDGSAHRPDQATLPVTDRVMRDTFWIGVYPGLGKEVIAYMVETIRSFVSRR